ncbi:MAG: hypothetical protein RM022_030825 [Nostoc sp. EfeVER01]|nr:MULTISPECIES: hypothetical protein [unclassified Nostoc]MDZ7949072.1 hypothetical protein [Nostoc sp. EfeVER01]MDZ7995480.1 hypothetical protein [Nostoc sp. EspVER01]
MFTTAIIEKKAKLMSDTAMVAIALPRKNGALFSTKPSTVTVLN